MRRQEVEDAACGVEPGQSRTGRHPRVERHQQQRQDQQPSERAHHHDPVEQLQRPLDPSSDEQQRHTQQERADADQVDGIHVRRPGNASTEQEEDRARRHAGRRRPSDLQEEQDGVEPRPHDRVRPRAHEAGEHRLAGRDRVAHQLGVEDGLEEHGHGRDPEQRQAVTDEDGRTEQELAAADRRAQDDHAGPDSGGPAQAPGCRRGGELRVSPGVETGTSFGRIGQDSCVRRHGRRDSSRLNPHERGNRPQTGRGDALSGSAPAADLDISSTIAARLTPMLVTEATVSRSRQAEGPTAACR